MVDDIEKTKSEITDIVMPNNGVVTYDAGMVECMLRTRKLKEAENILEPLIKNKSDFPMVWHHWGCLQMNLSNYGDAERAFEQCVKLDPKHDGAWYNLGTISLRKDDRDAAMRAFWKVKEVVPDAIIPRIGKAVVFIGIPHYGKVNMEFMMSYVDMISRLKPSDNIEVEMTNCCGSRITSNRNQLAKLAMRRGATHILWIDSDMSFPPNALQRLLAHQKDIVCATTCKRGDEDGTPIGSAAGPSKDGKVELGTGLVEMTLVGSCFMLVKLDVYEKIGLPAYYEPPNPEDGDAFGEDITFCKLAREAGFKIWLDFGLSVELGHWGEKMYHIKPVKKENLTDDSVLISIPPSKTA